MIGLFFFGWERLSKTQHLMVTVLGDESGYTVGESQQTKLAAMEAMWGENEEARAQAHRVD